MGFIQEIVEATRRSVEAPTYAAGVPLRAPRSRPSFVRALERDRETGALVVEFKRVSPGQAEPVLPRRSIRQFLDATQAASPTAFSCLATASRFEGSPSDVTELVRSTDRPVLFKDFVVDDRQVEVAARTGASALLLIARLESEGHLTRSLASLAESAHRHGLEVLLEFHDRTELSRGAGVAADMYGVNARDLDTLRVDREAAAGIVRKARESGLRPLLGLSGVEDAADAHRFWTAGVDAILVGSAAARSEDPASFLATLRRPSVGGAR